LFEIKLTVGDIKLLSENDILNSIILNVDFIDEKDERPIEINIIKEENL